MKEKNHDIEKMNRKKLLHEIIAFLTVKRKKSEIIEHMKPFSNYYDGDIRNFINSFLTVSYRSNMITRPEFGCWKIVSCSDTNQFSEQFLENQKEYYKNKNKHIKKKSSISSKNVPLIGEYEWNHGVLIPKEKNHDIPIPIHHMKKEKSKHHESEILDFLDFLKNNKVKIDLNVNFNFK